MREIKFRAWDKERNQMQYLELTDERHVSEGLIIKGSQLTRNEDLSEWMQFTGLRDRNNTEIYDGDLLTDDATLTKYVIKVYWREESIGWWATDGYTVNVPLYHMKGCEIIGNIYETPGLLKETNHV